MVLPPSYTMTEYNSYCETISHLDIRSMYIWSSILKTISSFIAMPLVLYMVIMRKFLMYNEVNILINFKAAVLFIYALTMFLATGMQLLDLYLSTNPCDRIKYTPTCVWYKAFNYANTFGISASMLVLGMDAGLHMWLGDRRRRLMKWLNGGLFAIVTTCYLAIIVIFYVIDSQANLLHIHCMEDSALTRPYALFFSMVQATMDAMAVVLQCFLLVYCKRQLRLKRADLNQTFAVRQSLTLLTAFFPLTIYHSVTLVFYNIVHAVIRFEQDNIDRITMKNWSALTNIIPYYVCGAPILLMVVLRKIKKRRDDEIFQQMRPTFNGKVVPEANLYFEMLHKTWTSDEKITVKPKKSIVFQKKSKSQV